MFASTSIFAALILSEPRLISNCTFPLMCQSVNLAVFAIADSSSVVFEISMYLSLSCNFCTLVNLLILSSIL